MNTDTILRLLTNSGFRILDANADFVYIEDPSCILRSFATFIEYAWIIICVLTALLLTGWAISMIRGAKNDLFSNLFSLTMIFATLGMAIPIVNEIWGGNLFARGCRRIPISISETMKILEARDQKLGHSGNYNLYENLIINDTGPIYGITIPADDIQSSASLQTDEYPASNSAPGTATPTSNAPDTATNQPTHTASQHVAATESGKDVIFTTANGTKYKRTGGSRAWRNINPGNLRFSDFARRMGAIGQAGGFAVFPDEKTGMNAIEQLLRSDSYNKLTVAGAISRYAPPFENDTAAYHRQIEKLTGLNINKRMSDLSAQELTRVATAIRTIEGWTPGKETIISGDKK